MAAPRKYPEELRERAIRMRLGRPGRPGVRSGGGCPVGAQLGMIADTLRGWVTQAEVDAGGRPGTTTPTPRTWSIWIGRTASCVEPTRSADGVGFLGGGARPPLPVIINYIERSRTCSELIRSAPRWLARMCRSHRAPFMPPGPVALTPFRGHLVRECSSWDVHVGG